MGDKMENNEDAIRKFENSGYIIKGGISQEEWIRMKFNEIFGMMGKVMKRIDILEKLQQRMLEEEKEKLEYLERYGIKLRQKK